MKRRRKPARMVQQSLFNGLPVERSDEAVERGVMAALEGSDYSTLPREITEGFTPDAIRIHDVAGTALFCDRPSLPKPVTFGDKSVCSMTEATFRDIIKQAMAAGFITALKKYRKQLAGISALSRFYERQRQSQRLGRVTQSKRKANRAAEAIAMAKAGGTIAEIVTHFRQHGMPSCNRSTVYRWLKAKTDTRRS